MKHLRFATGECQITFLDDQTITATLEEFEQRASIQLFVNMFSNSVEKLLRAGGTANLAARHNRVHCVLTGGEQPLRSFVNCSSNPCELTRPTSSSTLSDPTPGMGRGR